MASPLALSQQHSKIQPALLEAMGNQAFGNLAGFGLDTSQSGLENPLDGIQIIIESLRPELIDRISQTIEALDGSVELILDSKIQARVSERAIEVLAGIAEVEYIRLPFRATSSQGNVISQGQSLLGAQPWHEGSFLGEGVKVGIIDAGFFGYQDLLGIELPPAELVTLRSFRADRDIECAQCGDSDRMHGLAVAEIVHDMAPEAELFLANFSTALELQVAVNWMIENGVVVVNTSFGFFTTSCPYEGTGILEPVFEDAKENGIFWAASAGNDGLQHFASTFNDNNGNQLHSFAVDDETQTLSDLEEGESVVVILWWDDPCTAAINDYDLILVDSNGEEIDRSFRAGPRAGTPLEALVVTAPTTGTYELQLERTEGVSENRFSMIFLDQQPEHFISAGSAGLTEPEMSQHVVSVSATDLLNRVERFSSQGPSPDGRQKPDISATDGVANATFGPSFFGTSASSPHVAGAGALVKFAFPEFSPDEIRSFLINRAEDLGAPGHDGQFGHGILNLGAIPDQLPNRKPRADAGDDQTVLVDMPVQLSGTRSFDLDEDELLFGWTLLESPESSAAELDDITSATPLFIPDLPGDYLFELTVTDPLELTSIAQVLITALTQSEQGELIVVRFLEVNFDFPLSFDRRVNGGCVIYLNNGDSAALIHITLFDASNREFVIPVGREVLLCGDVIHVDTRASE
jgi:hypothetical protein